MKLGTMLMAGLLVTSAAACKKKEKADEGGKVTEGSDKGSAKGTDKGSAMGSDKGTDKGTDQQAAAPKTPEEVAKAYLACWDDFNSRNWDGFKGCFADDVVTKDLAAGSEASGADAAVAHAKGFADAFSDAKGAAQLILVGDHKVAGVWLFTGTNDGVMKTPMGDMPATSKKIGILIVHGVEFNADGKAKEEWMMMDAQSFMGQLGQLPEGTPFRATVESGVAEPIIAIAKNDDTEKANLDAEKAELDAFNAHNVDGMAAMLSEDVMWSEAPMAKDMNKKELGEGMKAMYGAFSDLKLDPVGSWAAGDFTISAAQMSGTNDKPMKEMMLDGKGGKFAMPTIKISERKDGKITKSWIFYNGMSMWTQLHPDMAGGGEDKPADDTGTGDEHAADGNKPE